MTGIKISSNIKINGQIYDMQLQKCLTFGVHFIKICPLLNYDLFACLIL